MYIPTPLWFTWLQNHVRDFLSRIVPLLLGAVLGVALLSPLPLASSGSPALQAEKRQLSNTNLNLRPHQ